eukprot:16673-Heterococcus_DN1.PRE.1
MAVLSAAVLLYNYDYNAIAVRTSAASDHRCDYYTRHFCDSSQISILSPVPSLFLPTNDRPASSSAGTDSGFTCDLCSAKRSRARPAAACNHHLMLQSRLLELAQLA